MVIWLCLRWWYGAGWQWAAKRSIVERINWCNENFSVLALMRTWFAPFKQTYNAGARGSIDIRLHNLLDNFVSRCIGAVVRTALIGCGVFLMALSVISGLVFLVIWPLIPLALPVSIAMMAFGVGR